MLRKNLDFNVMSDISIIPRQMRLVNSELSTKMATLAIK